jgi:uncharacterized protein
MGAGLPLIVLAGPDEQPGATLDAIAAVIEAAGIPIVLVKLDPRVTDDAVHEQRYRAALGRASEPVGPVIIGGFSLGGRIAARLCPELAPRGLLCFGYPFHAAKLERARHGLEALSGVSVPTVIIQGTRDPHGSEARVRGYALPDTVALVWLRDGNHRFVPRERSGLTRAGHIDAAAAAAISFIRDRR